MLKDIVEARPAGEYKLYVRFEDGVEGEIDLSKLIEIEGVFATLRDVREVAKVRVDAEHGTVSWPNGADLDPDVLYSLLTGKPIELKYLVVRHLGVDTAPEAPDALLRLANDSDV